MTWRGIGMLAGILIILFGFCIAVIPELVSKRRSIKIGEMKFRLPASITVVIVGIVMLFI
jgi:hypothetical protein